jgi:NAD(P)H-flavin reductase
VSEAAKRFQKAVAETSGILSVAEGRDLAEIYALYKQASAGDNTTGVHCLCCMRSAPQRVLSDSSLSSLQQRNRPTRMSRTTVNGRRGPR